MSRRFLLAYLIIPIVVVTAALGVRMAFAVWTPPSVGPIGGQPDPPLNTSAVVQSKRGGLNIATVSGNVGIGTTDPGAKLDVAGRIWQTTTGQSVFLGEGAGDSDDLTDNRNIFVGYQAGYSNTTGVRNAALGYQALLSNTTGAVNTALGYQALLSNTTGVNNTAFGFWALLSNTTGSSNIALGWQAGRFAGGFANATSTDSMYLGANTRALASGDTNEIVIGNNATGLGSNTVVLGNNNITTTALKGNVGIGTTSPGAKLEIADGSADPIKYGSLQITRSSTNNGNSQLYLSMIRAGITVGGLGFIPNTNKWGLFNWNTSNPVLTVDGGNVGIGTTNPQAELTVAGQGHFSRDNAGECCSNGDYTIGVSENTAGTGRLSRIQFHNAGQAEGFIVLTPGFGISPAGREFVLASFQTDMDLRVTGQIIAEGQGLMGCLNGACSHLRWRGDGNNYMRGDLIVDGAGGTPANIYAAGLVRGDAGVEIANGSTFHSLGRLHIQSEWDGVFDRIYLNPWHGDVVVGGGGGPGVLSADQLYDSGSRVCTAANGLCGGGGGWSGSSYIRTCSFSGFGACSAQCDFGDVVMGGGVIWDTPVGSPINAPAGELPSNNRTWYCSAWGTPGRCFAQCANF